MDPKSATTADGAATDRGRAGTATLPSGPAAKAALETYSYLAAASHDIRTALVGILGMADLLLDSRLDAGQRRYAEALRSAGEGLLDIVDDVMDLNRIEAGQVVPSAAAFAPRAILTQLEPLLVQKASVKGLRVVVDVSEEVPQTLCADRALIRRVVYKLAWNAVRLTDHGTISLRLTPAECAGDVVVLRFEVADSGAGIDASELAALFGPNPPAGARGLGLAFCRRLAETLGGTLGVESSLGLGSRFWFTVPCSRGVAEDGRGAAPTPASPRLKVLVAEDNEINQMYLAAVLERAGHAVDMVGTGSKAVAMARWSDYDVILMDVRLPVMDGIEATRAIRALGGRRARVPIVALTADALAGARERLLAVGMSDYVTKPVDAETLAGALSRATGKPVQLSPVLPDAPEPAVPAAGVAASLEDLARRLDAIIEETGPAKGRGGDGGPAIV